MAGKLLKKCLLGLGTGEWERGRTPGWTLTAAALRAFTRAHGACSGLNLQPSIRGPSPQSPAPTLGYTAPMAQVVAVVGASRDRRKFGNKAVRAFLHRGYDVVPINPEGGIIEGIPTYASVLDVPRPIDIATVYHQPATGERVIEEIARKAIGEVWLNPGADGARVVARARALGLNPILDCSIVGIGENPASYSE